MTTAKELIEELSKLPPESAVAFPVQWTYETLNELWEDALKKPLTQQQWAEVAEDYLNALNDFFWAESEDTMQAILEEGDYLKEEY